jgi:hypothetical protein
VDIGNFTVDTGGIITDLASIMFLTTPPSKEQNKNQSDAIDPLVDRILRLSAAYGRACDLPRVTVSWRLFGDSKKLDQLHAGKDLVTRRAEAALGWFAAHWPDTVEPPAEMIAPARQRQPDHPLCAHPATVSDVPIGSAARERANAPALPPACEPAAPRRPGFRFSGVGWNGSERSRWEREVAGPPKGESRADKVLRRFSWQEEPVGREFATGRGRQRSASTAEPPPPESTGLDGPEPSAETRLAHWRPDPERSDPMKPGDRA